MEENQLTYVKNVNIKNFRGFKSEGKDIEFSIPSGNKSGINIILGENCSGKTTILEIIKLSFRNRFNEALYLKKGTIDIMNDMNIKILYNNGSCNIINDSYKLKYEYLDEFGNENQDLVQSVKIMNIPAKKMVTNKYIHNRSSVEDFLINHKSYNGKTINRREDDLNNTLLSCLIDIDNNCDERKKFNLIFHKFIPNMNWQISIGENDNFIIEFIDQIGESNTETSGDGLISILYIAITFYIMEKELINILLIDEPEVSLHPKLMKKVMNVLIEYSDRYQIFISTHSSHFVNWNILEKGGSILRTVKEKDGINVYKLKNELIKKILTSKSHPHIGGLDAKDSLFINDGLILVEGQEDVICFNKLIDKADFNQEDFDFYGWGANGADTIVDIAMILKSLGFKKIVMIFDNDEEGDLAYRKACSKFSKDNYLIKKIEHDDIRDKWIKIYDEISLKLINTKMYKKGLFDKNFNLKKGENIKFYKSLLIEIKEYLE